MVQGKSFDIYNFTDGELVINELEQEGMNSFHWYIDPWNLILPHTMAFADTLTLNVKIDMPVDNILGQLVVDTLDIFSETGHHKVVIKVDEELLSSIFNPNYTSSISRIDKISPNPFNDQTRISFSLDQDSKANLVVYNLQGQIIKTLAAQDFKSGSHEITWEGKDNSGNEVSNGIYLLKLETERGVDFRKLVFSR
jgi:hypothetical protein